MKWESSPLFLVRYGLSVFVLDTPGKCGNTFRRPAAYRIHGPLYPSVVLTEPPGDARYGSLIMLWWFIAIREAVPDLQTGYRSAPYRASWRSSLMWLLITDLCLKNVYSVVKEHLVRRPRNNLVVTGRILSKKRVFAVGPVGLLYRPRRPTFTDSVQSETVER